VFDGHCGTDAVRFVKSNLLKFIIEDNHFPNSLHKAIRSAFMKTDHALADSNSLDHYSGTTVLMALIFEKFASTHFLSTLQILYCLAIWIK
jgi:protein phosphatase PTC2/3